MSSTNEKSFERGDVLMNLGRYEEAIPFLVKARSIDPQDVNPVLHLSTCFYQLGKTEEALAYAEQGISLVPHFEYGHRSRSVILAKFERFEESLESALEAVRLAPESFFTLGNLANAYLRARRLEKAKETAELLIKLFPEESRSHEKFADISLEVEDYDNAEKAYRVAIRLNPENSRLRNQLGIVLLEQFQTETGEQKTDKRIEALQHFADTLKIAPNNSYALNNLKITLLEPPDRHLIAVFFPFVILGMFITPVWSVLVLLLVFWLYKSYLNDSRKQFDSLPPEMRKALEPNFYQNNFRLSPNVLFPHLNNYFSRLYLQLLIALSVALSFYVFAIFTANDLFPLLLKVIFILNLLWITRTLFQTPGFENNKSDNHLTA